MLTLQFAQHNNCVDLLAPKQKNPIVSSKRPSSDGVLLLLLLLIFGECMPRIDANSNVLPKIKRVCRIHVANRRNYLAESHKSVKWFIIIAHIAYVDRYSMYRCVESCWLLFCYT